jgi:AcrR family transcriptional regulator
MSKSFISIKDRIVADAIKLISDSGVESLSLESVAMMGGVPLDVVIRNFGDRDGLLVEVCKEYVKFDPQVEATIESKDISHMDKIFEYFKMLATYYTNYGDVAAFVVDYESFLHIVATRNIVSECIARRRDFIMKEYELAVKCGEVKEVFTPNEFATILFGSCSRDILYRHITSFDYTHAEFVVEMYEKLLNLIRV